jgi:hypothetical protein
MAQVDFRDIGTNSGAFVAIRLVDGNVAIGLGIETDGDLDLLVKPEDARRIGQALLDAGR